MDFSERTLVRARFGGSRTRCCLRWRNPGKATHSVCLFTVFRAIRTILAFVSLTVIFSCDFVQTMDGVYFKEGAPPDWSVILVEKGGNPNDPRSWQVGLGPKRALGKWPVMEIAGFMNKLCPLSPIGVMFQKKDLERKMLVVFSPNDLCLMGGNPYFCGGFLLLLGEGKN